MEYKLAPSILAADFANLGSEVVKVSEEGAQYIHLDVMDGVFVPSISFGFPVISAIRGCTKSIFDIHLMIVDPIRYIQTVAECGADLITFHYEACTDEQNVIDTIAEIRKCGCKVGIAIKPATEVEAVKPYLKLVDMLLIMTVEPGFGGQKYMSEHTEKIRQARALITEMNLDTDIEVDGGIKLANVNEPVDAGANVIVAGTAIFNGDVRRNVRDFMDIFQNKQ